MTLRTAITLAALLTAGSTQAQPIPKGLQLTRDFSSFLCLDPAQAEEFAALMKREDSSQAVRMSLIWESKGLCEMIDKDVPMEVVEMREQAELLCLRPKSWGICGWTLALAPELTDIGAAR